jgi:hypothetical protein
MCTTILSLITYYTLLLSFLCCQNIMIATYAAKTAARLPIITCATWSPVRPGTWRINPVNSITILSLLQIMDKFLFITFEVRMYK